MLTYELGAWCMAVVDLGVVLAVLFRPGRQGAELAVATPDVSFIHLISALLVMGVLGGLKLALAFAGMVNLFGLIRLTYTDLVVVLPVTGLFLLIAAHSRRGRARWRISRPVRIVALLLLVPAPIGVYATFVEPFRTQLERPVVRLSADRLGSEPVRIGILADIQTQSVSQHEEAGIDRLHAEAPDVILVPGDLWQGTAAELKANWSRLRGLLGRLQAPGGAYFVIGNCEDPEDIKRILEGTPVRMLVNEIVRVRVHGRDLTIGGVELNCTPAAEQVVDELESAPATHDIRILVSHYPDWVLHLRSHSRIDLVTAGHTHGGQIVIPGFGPPLTLSHVPRHVAAGGLHELDGRTIYVSRGLGCEHGQAPRMRFFCPPEVTLLTMENATK